MAVPKYKVTLLRSFQLKRVLEVHFHSLAACRYLRPHGLWVLVFENLNVFFDRLSFSIKFKQVMSTVCISSRLHSYMFFSIGIRLLGMLHRFLSINM